MKKKSRPDVVFQVSTIFKDGPGSGDLLIIAHRDLDGLISAFLLATAVREQYEKVDVIFSQPYLGTHVRKYVTSGGRLNKYSALAMVDLSVDYARPPVTHQLFTTINCRLAYLFDHHSGWDKLLTQDDLRGFNVAIDGEKVLYNSKFTRHVILGNEPCCAKLIYDFFNLDSLENQYLQDILRVALVSDDLSLRQDVEGSEIYNIFTRFKNNNIEACLTELLTNTEASNLCTNKVNWYHKNSERAGKLLNSAEEIYPGIAYIRAFSDTHINYTLLCEQAYRKYKVLIVKELDAHNLKMSFTIAHNLPDLDLTKVFNLRGGSPKRVTLCRKNLTIDDIVEELKPYIGAAINEVSS